MPKKAIRLEMSLKSFIVWCAGLFFLIAWIFIMGILVGRGDLSFGKVKDKLAVIPGISHEPHQGDEIDKIVRMEENLKLDFYDELSSKKKAAAQKSYHTAEVKPIAPKPKVEPKKSVEKRKITASLKGDYVLQVGSFQEKEKASVLVKRLEDRNYPAFLRKVDVGGKTYYRVKCGPFQTEEKADELKDVLAKREHINGFVARAD